MNTLQISTSYVAFCTLALTLGCSAAGTDNLPGAGGQGGGNSGQPGCTKHPDCRACQDCVSSCMCSATADRNACSSACGVSGDGGSGQGGSFGQGGTAGSFGAAGTSAGGTGVGGTGVGGAGVGGTGVGGTGVGGTGVGGTGVGGAGGTSSFPPVTDFAAPGPFNTASAPEGPACTIFRPATLGEGGRLHPVIVWGNGTTNTPSSYTALFNHFASHGFIVAAANTSNSGSGNEMIACLDYVLAQNGAAGSPYQGRVDANHLASSGYSQGGAGALMAGRDPRFTVTAPVAPYIVFPLGGFSRGSVGQQTHPMFLVSGSSDTVAAPSSNQAPIFSEAKVPIVWGTLSGATHFEVLGDGKGYRGPLTAWFRFKLMGDASAGAYFEKNACSLCSAGGWAVQHNSLWQ